MKRKILFLIYQLVNGGAEKIMVDIANNIDKEKYEVTVMTIIDCSLDSNILNNNINYKHIFSGNLKIDRIFFRIFYWLDPKILYKIFISKQYDIEIAALEGIPSKIISGSNNQSKKINIIHADANNIAWPSNRYKNINQETNSYNSFDKLIFVSNNTMNKFSEKFEINVEKMKVIYNPFNIDYIRAKSSEAIDDYKQKKNKVICAIGRLDYVKGFDRLIEAFYIIYQQDKDLELLIIGEGNERQKLEVLIKKYNLNNVVTLLGNRVNPYKYLKMSSCYICSSRSEGLSSTVIEAMILNIPIITTKCGGMNEILSGSNAMIVDNNIKGLVKGMQYILDDSILNKMSFYKNEMINKFSYKKYFSELEKIL